MNELKSIATSKDNVSALSQSIANALSLEMMASIFAENITDPAIAQALSATSSKEEAKALTKRIVGKKIHKPLNRNIADTLTAKILGFNNTHELNAHISSITLYSRWSINYNNRYDSGNFEIYVPKGYIPTSTDVAIASGSSWEPHREEDRLTVSHIIDDVIELPENAFNTLCEGDISYLAIDADSFLTSNDENTTPSINDRDDVFADKMRDFVAATDCESFEYSEISLNHLGTGDYSYDYFSTDKITSVKEMLTHLAGKMLGDDAQLNQHMFDRMIPNSPIGIIENATDGIDVRYDFISGGIAAYDKDGNLIYLLALQVKKNDARLQPYFS